MREDTGDREEYRDSHASPNYGTVYEKTYEEGYYRDQWELIERPLLHSLLTDLRNSVGENCLDFACGTGRITQLAEGIFPSVVGVDVSATMLTQARLNCSKASLIEQDITSSALDRKFDVITAFRFFLNAQPKLRASALQAIHGSLRDGGRLVLNIHVNSSSMLGYAYRIRNFVRRRIIAKTCSIAEIRTYLLQAGFVVDTLTWYSYLPRVGWRFPHLNRRLMLPVERFCKWFPLVPRKAAQSFLIVAKKTDSK